MPARTVYWPVPPLQIFQDKENPEDWRVEDNDADGDGGVK
jgi:hypothetical protein